MKRTHKPVIKKSLKKSSKLSKRKSINRNMKLHKGGMIRSISRLPMEQLNRTNDSLVCRTTMI